MIRHDIDGYPQRYPQSDNHCLSDVSLENMMFFIVLLAIFATATSSTPPRPVATISDGALRGTTMTTLGGRTVFAFLGVPYARPPLAELRFQPPKRPEPWEGVRDAAKDGDRCAQLTFPERNFDGSEDCLFLSIYTTQLPAEGTDLPQADLHDVVVLLHGGSFQNGAGDSGAFMPDHLLDHPVVLVGVNYRLGPIGFLATNDEHALGNAGLKDQVEALHWVHRHIHAFGGNAASVTLLGVQAGASSAHLHVLSPLSRDRFHGVISMSGTALSPSALVSTPVAKQRAVKLGQLVGCDKETGLVECLRRVPAKELVESAPKTLEWPTDYSHAFGPVVEPPVPGKRAFLPLDPVRMMTDLPAGPHGRWRKPWLVGIASHEGLPFALQAMVFPYIMTALKTDPGKYVPLFLGMEEANKDLGLRAWDFYLRNKTLAYGTMPELAEMVTDYTVLRGVWRSVALVGDRLPVFAYRFSYDRRTVRMSLGVPQGDDVEYLFPNILAGKKRTYRETELPAVRKLAEIVATFAKHGDPTPEGSTLLGEGKLWPQATAESFEFVDIGNEFTVHEGFYPERMAFWEDVLPTSKPKHDEL